MSDQPKYAEGGEIRGPIGNPDDIAAIVHPGYAFPIDDIPPFTPKAGDRLYAYDQHGQLVGVCTIGEPEPAGEWPWTMRFQVLPDEPEPGQWSRGINYDHLSQEDQ